MLHCLSWGFYCCDLTLSKDNVRRTGFIWLACPGLESIACISGQCRWIPMTQKVWHKQCLPSIVTVSSLTPPQVKYHIFSLWHTVPSTLLDHSCIKHLVDDNHWVTDSLLGAVPVRKEADATDRWLNLNEDIVGLHPKFITLSEQDYTRLTHHRWGKGSPVPTPPWFKQLAITIECRDIFFRNRDIFSNVMDTDKLSILL